MEEMVLIFYKGSIPLSSAIGFQRIHFHFLSDGPEHCLKTAHQYVNVAQVGRATNKILISRSRVQISSLAIKCSTT